MANSAFEPRKFTVVSVLKRERNRLFFVCFFFIRRGVFGDNSTNHQSNLVSPRLPTRALPGLFCLGWSIVEPIDTCPFLYKLGIGRTCSCIFDPKMLTPITGVVCFSFGRKDVFRFLTWVQKDSGPPSAMKFMRQEIQACRNNQKKKQERTVHKRSTG